MDDLPMASYRQTGLLLLVATMALLAPGALAGAHAANQEPGASSSQPSSETPSQDQPQLQEGTSSSRKGKVHHVRVEEEGSTRPELTQAEDLIQKKNYAAAEPLLHKVVASNDVSYVAWFDLGFVENELGKEGESIAAYRKSVAAKPDVFESNLNLGLQLAKTGQHDAEQFLRAATQLKPTSHIAEGQERAWLSLGHVIEKEKPEEAVVAYRKAAALRPKDPEPHVTAGMVLEKENKFSDAEQEYQQALALDPASDAITGLINISMRGRRFPEAEGYLRKLASAHPDDSAAHVQLGRVLAAQGKNEDAIAELQAGAKLAPNDQFVERDLADLYSSAGKNDLAETAYRKLIASHPNDAELHHELGKSLLLEKKFAGAQQEFLVAIKLKPDYGEAYGDLAFAASENKDYPLTLKALEARAKFLAENPLTYFLRASAYDHLKNVKQASVNYHLFLNAANGKYPDQEWQAKHRLIALEPKK
jgi:Flp pilus assembly protein TadD